MEEQVEAMLAQKRNRAIAIIMSVKEDQCDQYLPDEARASLRKVVLDQINGLHNMAIELMKSSGPGVHLNQFYLDKIDVIYDNVVEQDGSNSEG